MTACTRDEQVSALLPLVRRLARRLKRLVPAFDMDDLVGDGSLGLLRAVDSFDPLRGPQLEDYARRLIVGAMLNGIRRMDPVSERARRIVRDGENQRYTLAAAIGDSQRCPDRTAVSWISPRTCGGLPRTAALARRSAAGWGIVEWRLERRPLTDRRAPPRALTPRRADR
ncbi:MAG TPA: sigma factor, partial [Candidatus Cybelea sp.]